MRHYFRDEHFVSLLSLFLFTIVGVWTALRSDFLFAGLCAVLWIRTAMMMRREESKRRKSVDQRN